MKYVLAAILSLALAGCGGGSDSPTMVAASDTTLAVSPTVTSALVNETFTFNSGVPSLGTTATTSLTFTSTATTPEFSITSGGNTASGTTTFGSCIFAVTRSTFPAGHALALGQTVTVNPCNVNINTRGGVANGVATSRSVALLLGAAASAGATVTVGINPNGGIVLNGNIVTTITLTPLTGG